MNNIDEEFVKLEEQAGKLKAIFIDTISDDNFTPTAQDDAFSKAFFVLFHACLEDFFEKIIKNLAIRSISSYSENNFVNNTDINDIDLLNKKIKSQIDTYIMLVSYANYSSGEQTKPTKMLKELYDKIEKNYRHDDEITDEFFDTHVKKVEDLTKSILENSNTIIQSELTKNHGASVKHLIKILLPVGIDIHQIGETLIEKIVLTNSLRKLAYLRGDYAHLGQNSTINQVYSKTDLQEIYNDCIKLCKQVRDLANVRFSVTD